MMLLAELGTGGFLVQGYPTGPTAHIGPEDAAPLREALAAAYGELPGREATPTEPAGADPAFVQIAAPPIVRPRIGLPEVEETRPLQVVSPWA